MRDGLVPISWPATVQVATVRPYRSWAASVHVSGWPSRGAARAAQGCGCASEDACQLHATDWQSMANRLPLNVQFSKSVPA
jgi:hypothetical protein